MACSAQTIGRLQKVLDVQQPIGSDAFKRQSICISLLLGYARGDHKRTLHRRCVKSGDRTTSFRCATVVFGQLDLAISTIKQAYPVGFGVLQHVSTKRGKRGDINESDAPPTSTVNKITWPCHVTLDSLISSPVLVGGASDPFTLPPCKAVGGLTRGYHERGRRPCQYPSAIGSICT